MQLLIKRNINQSKISEHYSKIYVETYRKHYAQKLMRRYEDTDFPWDFLAIFY